MRRFYQLDEKCFACRGLAIPFVTIFAERVVNSRELSRLSRIGQELVGQYNALYDKRKARNRFCRSQP
jgi:hypothetical protein